MRPTVRWGKGMPGQTLIQKTPDSFRPPGGVGEPLSPPIEPGGLIGQKSHHDRDSPNLRPAAASLFSDIGY